MLFRKKELYKGMFEPNKRFDPNRKPLDQKRVDLIKICYLKKVYILTMYNKVNECEFSEVIEFSLKGQKCRAFFGMVAERSEQPKAKVSRYK